MKPNHKNFYDAIGDMDGEFIEEAEVYKAAKRPKRPYGLLSAAAAIILLTLLILPMALGQTPIITPGTTALIPVGTGGETSGAATTTDFAPVTEMDLSQYQDHPLFSAMQAIADYIYHRDAMVLRPDVPLDTGLIDVGIPESPKDDADSELMDLTDNQVDGVMEGDLIKRTDTHVFYLNYDRKLCILSIGKGEIVLIGTSDPLDDKEGLQWTPIELYLVNQNRTLIIVSQSKVDHSVGDFKVLCRITAFDISDTAKYASPLQVTADHTVEGGYVTSRVAGDSVLVFTSKGLSDTFPFNAATFDPTFTVDGVLHSFTPENFTSPAMPCLAECVIVYLFDTATLTFRDVHASLGFGDAQYISKDRIYLITTSSERREQNGEPVLQNNAYHIVDLMSCITVLDYADGELTEKGCAKVAGRIKDRYSLDEYNGVLRVVTTTESTRYKVSEDHIGYVAIRFVRPNASLYLVSLDSFEIVNSVENFAPSGDSVRSVRFEKETLYVCTAKEVTDPVFFFDLSDVHNVTYKETDEIPGFSTSLIEYSENALLGVGIAESFNSLKLEIYREIEGAIVGVDQIVYQSVYYSERYKAYYIDRERGYFGIGVFNEREAGDAFCSYHLFKVEENKLTEITTVAPLEHQPYRVDPYFLRGFVLDGYLYVLSGFNEFSATPLAK